MGQNKRYQTQWTTQFYAAAELTRRGYLVALTFGNALKTDLMVESPNGHHFTIDVKGQANKSFWLVQQRARDPDHYFILIFLPKDNTAPQFFVLSSDELMRRREEYKTQSTARGKYRDDLGGINWTTAFEYRDKWENLPP
jgi:hypothetical protein